MLCVNDERKHAADTVGLLVM